MKMFYLRKPKKEDTFLLFISIFYNIVAVGVGIFINSFFGLSRNMLAWFMIFCSFMPKFSEWKERMRF